MKNKKNKLLFLDINRAIIVCLKCQKYKNQKENNNQEYNNIYFCSKEKLNIPNKKILPCILKNYSQKCMANFFIENIDLTQYLLWKAN